MIKNFLLSSEYIVIALVCLIFSATGAFASDFADGSLSGFTPSGIIHGSAEIIEASRTREKEVYPSLCPASMTAFVVSGEANYPGAFELCGPINVLSAILVAGGPSVKGSMREIEVSHSDTPLGFFDLYDYLENGHLPDDFVFNGGEVVTISPVGPRVTVSGAVKRPACYELLNGEMNLPALLRHAHGFASGVDVFRLEIIRVSNGRSSVAKSLTIKNGEKIPDLAILDGDLVNVVRSGQLDQLFFTIEGHVDTPGKIKFRQGMCLADVLINHVQFKNGAALDYAELLREGGPDQTYAVTGFSPAEILSGGLNSGLLMQPGDRVVFFPERFLRQQPIVSLSGAVKKPGHLMFSSGMTLKKLIEKSGGLARKPAGRAELTRRKINGGKLEITCLEVDLMRVVAGDPQHNLIMQPFDLLHIP